MLSVSTIRASQRLPPTLVSIGWKPGSRVIPQPTMKIGAAKAKFEMAFRASFRSASLSAKKVLIIRSKIRVSRNLAMK